MKYCAILSSVLVASAYAAPHVVKRQAELVNGLITSLKDSLQSQVMAAVTTNEPPVELFKQAKRKQLVFGPFKLNAADGPHAKAGSDLKIDPNSDMVRALVQDICPNCMILRADAEITDRNGKHLGTGNGVYVHHLVVAEHGKSFTMAPLIPTKLPCLSKSGNGMGGMGGMGGHSHSKRQAGFGGQKFSLFIGKGNEGDVSIYAPLNDTAVKSGYWLGAGTKMTMLAEVVNYKKQEQEVYLGLDIEYVQFPARPDNYLDVSYGAMTVDAGCADGISLTPPKDKAATYASSDMLAGAPGYIVGFTPHLHDGGLDLKLLVNGQIACTSDAVYGQDGGTNIAGQVWETITSYTPCKDPVKVKIGDRVKIVSVYDLTKHKLRPTSSDHSDGEAEAMALGMFQFAREKSFLDPITSAIGSFASLFGY